MEKNKELYFYKLNTNELGTLLCYCDEDSPKCVREIFSELQVELSMRRLSIEFEEYKYVFDIPKELLDINHNYNYFTDTRISPIEFLKELKHQQEEIYQNKSKEEISNIIKDKLRNIYNELHADEIAEKDAKIKILEFINSDSIK